MKSFKKAFMLIFTLIWAFVALGPWGNTYIGNAQSGGGVWIVQSDTAQGSLMNSPEKVKMEITITYNEVTLEKAAIIDKEIKAKHKGACNINIEIEQIRNNRGVWMGVYSIQDTTHIDFRNQDPEKDKSE